jgi:carbon monoxide dehydrogenase subunit G
MVKTQKSIVVQAPVAEVFAVLRDPMSNPKWLPGAQEVTYVKGEGVGGRFG